MPAEYVLTMDDFRRESVNRVSQNRRDEQRALWDAALTAHDAAIRAEGIAIGYRDGMKDGAAQTRAEVAREIRDLVDDMGDPNPGWRAGIMRAAKVAEGTP